MTAEEPLVRDESTEAVRSVRRWASLPVLILVFLGGAVLLPLDLAHRAYDQAVHNDEENLSALRQAVQLDPEFPLYRGRLAWLDEGRPWAIDQARRAAKDARGVGPLWLVTGMMERGIDAPWSRETLVRACRLNPLGAVAPFVLANMESDYAVTETRRAAWGARALLAEPRLLAAKAWADRPEMLRASVERAMATDGVNEGWRVALGEAAERILSTMDGNDLGEEQIMALNMDSQASDSLSLYAFRRRPWPVRLVGIRLNEHAADQIQLPPSSVLPTTAAGVFHPNTCTVF